MRLHWLRDQRGSILLFTTVLVVPLMIILAGLAMDLAYYGSVDDELQRSMDAAALAGAGNLGFDSSVFGTARQAAQNYAIANPYRAESAAKQINTSTFTLNAGNASSGNVVLGIWNGTTRTFTPSLDGTFVNAVRCRYTSSVPTFFLRLLGLNSLATGAQATAISAPPATIPPTSCLFPIGVTQCPFQTAGNFGSQGCGQPILYVSNSNTNTAAWINVGGTGSPSATNSRAAVTAAANGTSCSGSTLLAGNNVGANNGAITNVISGTGNYPGLANCNHGNGTCSGGYFIDKFNSPTTYTVHDSSGHVAYSGHGWEVTVAVISTNCPPGAVNQDHQILTWSRMVITQVISHGVCAVTNHYPGNAWDSLCSSGLSGSVDGLFGYYECAQFDSPPSPIPAPRAALATRLRLVQ